MNAPLATIAIAFVAGFAGGYFGQTLGSSSGSDAGDGPGVEVATLEEQVQRLRKEVHALRNPPEGLTAAGSPPSLAEDATARGLLSAEGGEAALLECIDARIESEVARRVAEAEKARGKDAVPASKKRLPLAQAAAELELSAREEDELRRIYAESQKKLFSLLAGPEEDPEDVKREVLELAGTKAGKAKLMGKYAPRLLNRIGDVMTMQAERQAAIVKALGPEKAKRLERDYSIEEDDFLGLGGEMSVGVEARVEDR